MESIPEYGDHLTLQEFIDELDSGSITPYDGDAYFATNMSMTHIKVDFFTIYSSRVQEDLKELGLTHVMWFNK